MSEEEVIDPLAAAKVDNPMASMCGDQLWNLQMTSGQQMVLRCNGIDIEHGVVVINDFSDTPIMYLPAGSWVAVYRVDKPGGAALPITHLIAAPVQQAVPLEPPMRDDDE